MFIEYVPSEKMRPRLGIAVKLRLVTCLFTLFSPERVSSIARGFAPGVKTEPEVFTPQINLNQRPK